MKIKKILFLFLLGFGVSQAQTNHKPILDDPTVKYFDLDGRPVQESFFKEKNMGFRMYFIMEKTLGNKVIRKKVWIDTIEKEKNHKY